MIKAKKMATGGLTQVLTGQDDPIQQGNSAAGNAGAQNDVMNTFESFRPSDTGFQPYSESIQKPDVGTPQTMKKGGKATTKVTTGDKKSKKSAIW